MNDEQVREALRDGADMLAAFVAARYNEPAPSATVELYPYLPAAEGVIEQMRAALAAKPPDASVDPAVALLEVPLAPAGSDERFEVFPPYRCIAPLCDSLGCSDCSCAIPDQTANVLAPLFAELARFRSNEAAKNPAAGALGQDEKTGGGP